MCGEAYLQSSKVAAELGPFAGYAPNRDAFLEVIGMHRHAAYEVPAKGVPAELYKAQMAVWDAALESGTQSGYKNGQVTVLAPTGTIGFMMDCDTTGVEPDLALVKYKKLVGGGTIKIVNQTVPLALKRLGYSAQEINTIVDYVDEKGTIEGAPAFQPEHLPVFDCAFRALNGTRSIHYSGHVRMMSAVQPFLSGAISKTVNLPPDATPDEIAGVYMEGWKQGLKAIAIYRDGCKRTQPLNTAASKSDTKSPVARGTLEYVGKATPPVPDAVPPQAPRRAPLDHPQVLRRRPRGLRHGRPLRGRQARRDLPEDVQGRLDHLGPHGRLRHGRLADAPVRRPDRGPGQQVLPRPLRALGLHQEPRDPDCQVADRLHLQVAREQVHDAPRRRTPSASSPATRRRQARCR